MFLTTQVLKEVIRLRKDIIIYGYQQATEQKASIKTWLFFCESPIHNRLLPVYKREMKTSASASSKKSGSKDGSNCIVMDTSYAIDAQEYRMLMSLRHSVKTIKKKDAGIDELTANHFLKGNFTKLSSPSLFQEILFPGRNIQGLAASGGVVEGFPKTVKELLEWDQITINETKIVKNAVEVLRNIKNKGQKEGSSMDEQTENILLPQIVQESLANHLIELVRANNCKISNAVAQLSQKIASPDEIIVNKDSTSKEVIKNNRNQLEETAITGLGKELFTLQKEYLGSHWTNVLSKDFLRFLEFEKLSKVDELGNVVVENMDNHSKVEEIIPAIQICWIELDDYLIKYYPAISIALDQMYALPHELNAKYIWDGPEFLEANRGCTMLVYYPPGSKQAPRLDCRPTNRHFDSGIR
jgi:hypothetical protein